MPPGEAHLIFLPGLGDDAYLWRHQTQHLSDLALPRVADITREDSVHALAESVLRNAPQTFALCGFSLGGYVALEIMRQAPERVRRFALIATNARADTEDRRSERLSIMATAEKPGGFDRVIRDQLGKLLAAENLSDVKLTTGIIGMANRVGREAFIRQNRACMMRSSSLDALGEISCQTLVVCARHDAAAPIAMSEQIARGIPGARLAIVEDAGHYVPLEQPQAVTALLRQWLTYD